VGSQRSCHSNGIFSVPSGWKYVSIALLAAGRLSVNIMMFLHPVVVALSMARRIANISAPTDVAFLAGDLIEDIW